MRSLIADGHVVPDALGLGIATDQHGALIDAGGRAARNLFYIGPMLRPRFWETTAVQELRVHAERLARHAAAVVESAGALTGTGARSAAFPAFL